MDDCGLSEVSSELQPDLSIIILVWRDSQFLAECLRSALTRTSTLSREVFVVNNGCARLDVEVFKDGPVQVIINRKNVGVARGRNQGLRVARGRYLLLLDVDTQVMSNGLETLVEFMDHHLEVGLAGPRLIDPKSNLQLSCRKFPTVLSKVLRCTPSVIDRVFLSGELLADWDHSNARPVDYVIGACQIIRRQALVEVGFLDECFFYGPEDIDYCIRMWQKGWAVYYVPTATVRHFEQRLSRRRPMSRLMWEHVRGLVYYFFKYGYLLDTTKLRQPM